MDLKNDQELANTRRKLQKLEALYEAEPIQRRDRSLRGASTRAVKAIFRTKGEDNLLFQPERKAPKMDPIAETDWKLLRQFRPLALNRFCQQVLSDAGHLATDQDKSPHHRYVALFDLIMRRNAELAEAFDDLRRSNALLRLACIRAHQLLTDDEFGQFTLATRNVVNKLVAVRSI
jgi:hypothetical protein